MKVCFQKSLRAGLFVALMLLGIGSSAFGQSVEQKLEDILAEITILKRAIAEQDRRIAEIEKALKAAQQYSVVPIQKQPSPMNQLSTPQTSDASWHKPKSWDKAIDGMSESQVIAILGKPTSIEDLDGGMRTLFYRGEVAGSGFVSGNVKLSDDRVWQVNKPIF